MTVELLRPPPAYTPVNEGPPGPVRAVPSPGAAKSAPSLGLRSTFRGHRWRIALTYILFNLENLLRLAQPWALGLAIHKLLNGSYVGLLLFGRSTRFTPSSPRAGALTIRGRSAASPATCPPSWCWSSADGRSTCRGSRHVRPWRELVDFCERGLPFVLNVLYSLIGALVMLALYDWVLVPISLSLLLPMGVISIVYGRTALGLNRRLNDELEREVDLIRQGRPEEVRGHYERVQGSRIRVMDRAVLNLGLMELFGFGLMAAALIRCCITSAADPGRILAMSGYILIFSRSLTGVPMIVEQVSRLRDIRRRLRGGDGVQ